MTPQRAMLASILLTAMILWLGFCVFPPPTRTLTEAPTATPTIRVVVLPTVYQFASVTPSPTVTAREMLPRETSTRVPTVTVTPTVAPSETPTPNTAPPVQRGDLGGSWG
jgi:hypothetical protein